LIGQILYARFVQSKDVPPPIQEMGPVYERPVPFPHSTRKGAALSDLRRSGGVPARRLKKESWNWLKRCDRTIAA